MEDYTVGLLILNTTLFIATSLALATMGGEDRLGGGHTVHTRTKILSVYNANYQCALPVLLQEKKKPLSLFFNFLILNTFLHYLKERSKV